MPANEIRQRITTALYIARELRLAITSQQMVGRSRLCDGLFLALRAITKTPDAPDILLNLASLCWLCFVGASSMNGTTITLTALDTVITLLADYLNKPNVTIADYTTAKSMVAAVTNVVDGVTSRVREWERRLGLREFPFPLRIFQHED